MKGRAPRLRHVPVVAAMLLSATACFPEAPDAQRAGVCVEESTQKRVEDERCPPTDEEGRPTQPGGGLFVMWFVMNHTGSVPAVGEHAAGGTRTYPRGLPVTMGVPRQGASAASGGMQGLSRGGFGARAGGSVGS